MGKKKTNNSISNSLSAKEEEIMACFWTHGFLFVREVVELLPDPKPHFNTVSTFVRGLESKGWLSHVSFGNTFRYFPIVGVEEYRRNKISRLVSRLFGNSYLSCVSSLVEDNKISVEDLKALINEVKASKDKTNTDSSNGEEGRNK